LQALQKNVAKAGDLPWLGVDLLLNYRAEGITMKIRHSKKPGKFDTLFGLRLRT